MKTLIIVRDPAAVVSSGLVRKDLSKYDAMLIVNPTKVEPSEMKEEFDFHITRGSASEDPAY